MNSAAGNGMVAARPLREHWRLWAAVVVLLAIAYWWTGLWMVRRWEAVDSYYSHGILIPFVSAFFVWSQRRKLAACAIAPSSRGPWVLGAGLLMHLVSLAWRIGFVSGFSLLVVLAGLILTFLGRQHLRLLSFPLIFLVFMVPIPEVTVRAISFKSKMIAAQMATEIVSSLGIAIVRMGSKVVLNSGTLIVDDVCSGLKYMISLTAFGAIYVYITRLKWQGRLIILALTVPLALIANVVRVTLMIIISWKWSPRAVNPDGIVHDILGIALFVAAFLLFFFIESILLLFLPRHEAEDDGPAEAAPEGGKP